MNAPRHPERLPVEPGQVVRLDAGEDITTSDPQIPAPPMSRFKIAPCFRSRQRLAIPGADPPALQAGLGSLGLPDYQKNRRAMTKADWLPPKWGWVDPLKDINAEIAEDRVREVTRGLGFRRPGSPAQGATQGPIQGAGGKVSALANASGRAK